MENFLKYDVDSTKLQSFVALVLQEKSNKTIYDDPFLFMKALKLELAKALESEMLDNIRKGYNPGIVHFSGLPQDEIIPSGESPDERNETKTRISEALILATAALVNCYLFSKKTEQNGAIFHNISPVKGKEAVISSVGRDPFYYHTEIAYAPKVPKFLMLYCLESDPNAKTSYFFIKDILEKIPEHFKRIMRKPIFRLSAVAGYDQDSTVCPLLSIESETNTEFFRFYQCIDRLEIETNDETERLEAESLLQFLKATIIFPQPGEEPAISLQKGEALLFNNGWTQNSGEHFGVMHGRVGRIENPNRWLQRGYFFDASAEETQQKMTAGYLRFLAIAFEKYPLKMAVACLKTAIEHSVDYQKIAKNFPADTKKSKLFWEGIQPRKNANSWLERIAREAEIVNDHDAPNHVVEYK